MRNLEHSLHRSEDFSRLITAGNAAARWPPHERLKAITRDVVAPIGNQFLSKCATLFKGNARQAWSQPLKPVELFMPHCHDDIVVGAVVARARPPSTFALPALEDAVASTLWAASAASTLTFTE